MRTVVIGLGNPILTDDSVGIQVVHDLGRRLLVAGIGPQDVALKKAFTGGLGLMDAMVGYDRAIIVDAMFTGNCPPGSVRTFADPAELCTRNTHSTHSASLDVALEAGREIGLDLPENIRVVGIEALDVETFGQGLTAPVAAAVPAAMDAVLRELADSGFMPGARSAEKGEMV